MGTPTRLAFQEERRLQKELEETEKLQKEIEMTAQRERELTESRQQVFTQFFLSFLSLFGFTHSHASFFRLGPSAKHAAVPRLAPQCSRPTGLNDE
jgi:hypothetical protein